ncbi:MAG: hypothetical protein WCE48_06455 [Steroidobacteraceae bacterium]
MKHAERTARYRDWLALAMLAACWSAEQQLDARASADAAANRSHARRESGVDPYYAQERRAALWRRAALAAARRVT